MGQTYAIFFTGHFTGDTHSDIHGDEFSLAFNVPPFLLPNLTNSSNSSLRANLFQISHMWQCFTHIYRVPRDVLDISLVIRPRPNRKKSVLFQQAVLFWKRLSSNSHHGVALRLNLHYSFIKAYIVIGTNNDQEGIKLVENSTSTLCVRHRHNHTTPIRLSCFLSDYILTMWATRSCSARSNWFKTDGLTS